MSQIRETFEKYATEFLREEMEYQMELNESWEDHCEIGDPAPTWEERFLMMAEDWGDEFERRDRTALRRMLIEIGFYREITQEEMDRMTIWRSGGGPCKKYEFQLDGKKWIAATSWYEFTASLNERTEQ